MNEDQIRELLTAVSRRSGVIDCFLDDVTDKREIEDRLGISRTTVNRAFRQLENVDAIVAEGGKYRLTFLGKLAHQQYEDLEGSYETLVEAKSLLLYLPSDAHLDASVLDGVDVLESSDIAPHEPIRRLEAVVRNGETVKGCFPVALPWFVDFFHEQVVEDGLVAEFIFPDRLVEYLLTAYNDEVSGIIGSGNGTIYRLSEDQVLPFGLVIVDDGLVWIGVYGEGNALRGAFVNTSEAAVAWCLDVFADSREAAEEVFLRGAASANRSK